MCTESADLVDIKSKAEDGFIQALTGGTAAIWTGRMGDSHYLLLITFHNLTGATDDTMEELWTWSAGGNIQYIVLYQFYFNIWFCTKCVSPPDNRSISFNKFGYTYKNWGTTQPMMSPRTAWRKALQERGNQIPAVQRSISN